jgi:transcriptional regulator with XRE-family HTH domain
MTKLRHGDEIVSRNIRAARIAKGISQEKLGAGLGLTFQQVQKYEKAHNRVSVGTLVQIAQILDTPIVDLLQGINAATSESSFEETPIRKLAMTKDGHELAAAFVKITDAKRRKVVINLAEAVAGS